MTYIKVSVPKPGNNAGVGGDKKSLITFIDLEDVVTFPQRDSKGIVITDNILMKDGAYMIQVYATTSSINVKQETEGEEDARGIIQSLEFSHPGSNNEIEEFIANWMNRDILCIVENCSTNKKRLLGTPCAALELEASSEDSKDSNKSTITLKSKNKSPYRIADYQGILSFADDEIVVLEPDTESFAIYLNKSIYQTSSGTTAQTQITGISKASEGDYHGMVITILGSGGDYPPYIEEGGNILLKNGVKWTGYANSHITFKIFEVSSGILFGIELSRS